MAIHNYTLTLATLLCTTFGCDNSNEVARRISEETGDASQGGTGSSTGGGSSLDATAGVARSCVGDLQCNGESCCTSLPVPGGTYSRGADPNYPATVSSFKLDKYEVTVGRFRSFVSAYDGWRVNHPAAGEGARPMPHPLATVSGWDPAWDAHLDANAAELSASIDDSMRMKTWSPEPLTADTERYPINAVTWYEAFAFCLWDGGWLPTEAEWEFAATGGSENRTYPWPDEVWSELVNDAPIPADCLHNHATQFLVVGSEPLGNGKWGQSDLAGSVDEWNLDWYLAPYLVPCIDCANLTSAETTNPTRVVRGGSWTDYTASFLLKAAYRNSGGVQTGTGTSAARSTRRGIRCARATL